MSGRRPEHILPPELYYNEEESQKYTNNTRIIEIQSRLSERAIELLALPEDESSLVLDIGCGSGLSGDVLTEQDHMWVGIDISQCMLDVARERELDGDLILGDIGNGLPFRASSFDAAISISALQWLCNADKSSHNPVRRIRAFFSSLYASLRRGGRAVLQFYPENPDQLMLLEVEALRAGFTGGLIIDFPNSTKAKKTFLVLDVGGGRAMPTPEGELGGAKFPNHARFEARRAHKQSGQRVAPKRSKAWIEAKKEKARNQQKQVARDSKYTARKRRPKF